MIQINKSLLAGLFSFLCILNVNSTTIECNRKGDWPITTTWIGGVIPSAADDIINHLASDSESLVEGVVKSVELIEARNKNLNDSFQASFNRSFKTLMGNPLTETMSSEIVSEDKEDIIIIVNDKASETSEIVANKTVSSFSPLILGSAVTSERTLPIVHLSFNAKKVKNKQIDIKWVTASEQSKSYFELERSYDGNVFEFIGRLDGQIKSVTPTNYIVSDFDFNSSEPVVYYRLKQVGLDGGIAYGPLITIFSNQELISTGVYPNPLQNTLNISVGKDEVIEQTELLNLKGERLILKSKMQNDNLDQLDVSELPPGTYLLKVKINDVFQIVRVLKA